MTRLTNNHPHAWLIAPNIARFCDPAFPESPHGPHADLPPFPGYVTQPAPAGPLPVGFPIRPRYARRAGKSYLELFGTRPASLYATGEQAGPLQRNGSRVTLWNTDSYGYNDHTPSLYQSHPFILGVRPESAESFGIIIETTYRSTIDLRHGVVGVAAEVEGPPPAVTVILRSSPQEVVQALAQLTGHMPLPPRWALGYHQCRYSYMTELEVRAIAQGFRSRRIPCDTIWLDIDYMDGYRCFTFSDERFPDPKTLMDDLHKDGFKAVAIIDPGLKQDDKSPTFVAGREHGHFVKAADGSDFIGPVWPGACAFPDFTRRRTREWWAGLHDQFLDSGLDGLWNDMNEPALFVPSRTMPADNRHDADAELGGPDTHARYHNLYGAQMARATHEALTQLRPERRPFVLTRAGFLGSQRHAATWTGDNVATWDHLRWSIPMALNLGLSGQPFSGPDTGGFAKDSDPRLFARWMGISSLLPFCRGHKNKGTKPHEPWALGPECEATCRRALERRYRLLPYLYTVFRESAAAGLPVVRPLFFADCTDTRLRCVDDSFLLGDHLLVRANVSPGAAGPTSPLPRGRWVPFELTDPDPELPQLLVRAGSLIPVGPVVQHTEEAVDTITLLCALDDESKAEGTLYEDAGDGRGFEGGDYRLTSFRVTAGAPPVVTEVAVEGRRAAGSRRISATIL